MTFTTLQQQMSEQKTTLSFLKHFFYKKSKKNIYRFLLRVCVPPGQMVNLIRGRGFDKVSRVLAILNSDFNILGCKKIIFDIQIRTTSFILLISAQRFCKKLYFI
jgi:hypothetical protein